MQGHQISGVAFTHLSLKGLVMCSGSTTNFSRERFVAEHYPRNGYQATSDLPTAIRRPNDSSVDPVHMASDRRPVLILRPAFRTLFLTRYQFGNSTGYMDHR
jgi:hypothetical protein